jgi:hypothetical protein
VGDDFITSSVPSGTGYTKIVGGNHFACAQRSTGGVLCWGDIDSDAETVLEATVDLDELG